MKFKSIFNEIADVVMGQSPSGEDVTNSICGLPLLNGPSEFTSFHPIPVQYTEKGKKFAKPNDILFCVRGSTTGKMNIADQKYAIGRGLAAIKGKNGYSTKYVQLILEQNLDRLLTMATGSTFPNVSRDLLLNFEVDILPVTQANEISNIFNKIDQKIELNTQINQTLEQIAQSLFKSWFVDFDPVRAKVQALSDGLSLEQAELAAMQAISGKTAEELTALSQAEPDRYAELAETAKAFPCEMVEVDGIEVPKGWEMKALDEVANYQNGLALQKFRPENDEPFLPVVKIAQLRQGYADGDEKAKASIKPECIIDNGDVVFSWSGSLLVDIWCGGKAALNQHLFRVSSKDYPKWFYYFYTKHHLTEFQRIAYDKAVTMGHIKREHLSAARCIVPNDKLLANKTLENILEKIILNRLENFNLQNTRDLLLPKLLSGDLDD
nr:restriction endonuclease subunit S [uncultured Haemophilus sp.]